MLQSNAFANFELYLVDPMAPRRKIASFALHHSTRVSTTTTPLSQEVSGVHDLELVFTSGMNITSAYVCAIDWFQFDSAQSAFIPLQAEKADRIYREALTVGGSSKTGLPTHVSRMGHRDLLHFKSVDFGRGARTVFPRMAIPTNNTDARLEVWIDGLGPISPDETLSSGTRVASVPLPSTGSAARYSSRTTAQFNIPLSTLLTGIHDVTILVRDDNRFAAPEASNWAHIDYIVFKP